MNMNARIVGEFDQDEHGRPDRGLALGRPLAPEAFRPGSAAGPGDEEPETAVLAAITSGYEHARARIISTPPSSPGRHRADPVPDVAAPGWAPTVPVDLVAGLPKPGLGAHGSGTVATGPRRRRELLRGFLRRLATDLGRAARMETGL